MSALIGRVRVTYDHGSNVPHVVTGEVYGYTGQYLRLKVDHANTRWIPHTRIYDIEEVG